MPVHLTKLFACLAGRPDLPNSRRLVAVYPCLSGGKQPSSCAAAFDMLSGCFSAERQNSKQC